MKIANVIENRFCLKSAIIQRERENEIFINRLYNLVVQILLMTEKKTTMFKVKIYINTVRNLGETSYIIGQISHTRFYCRFTLQL